MAPAPASDYVARVERLRREKDAYFKRDPHSPIPDEDRAAFTGLSYFPADPRWLITARARRVPEGEPIEMAMSRGGPRLYRRYARAAFRTPVGAEAELTLFFEAHDHAGHEPHELFVPFRDATSGRRTYGAGRYLEAANAFQAGDEEADVTLDFNLAYSPFCAYNEAYACPLPPRENRLDAPVEAGERHEGA
jgi:uncharacterized protein (DUF1684 family)